MSRNVEDLKEEIMLGYGCVVVPTAEKNDEEKKKQYINTKSFALTSRMMNPDNILMDVITSRQRIRPELEKIIEAFKQSGRIYPSGVIVISSIFDLGTTQEEIFKNYARLDIADIGVIVIESDDLSTANYGCEYRMDYGQRIALVEGLQKGLSPEIKTKRGRRKRNIQPSDITEDFKKVYWGYEHYFLSDTATYENKIFPLNKVSFREYSRVYEGMPEYETDEQAQEFAAFEFGREYKAKIRLSDKPKRFGKVPDSFDKLEEYRKEGMPLKDACERAKIPEMTETTYWRFLIKRDGKKSLMTKMSLECTKPDYLDN